MAGSDARETISRPGWVAATDAEQDGVSVATAIHAFWTTLIQRTPKMSRKAADRLTERYLDRVMNMEPLIEPDDLDEA